MCLAALKSSPFAKHIKRGQGDVRELRATRSRSSRATVGQRAPRSKHAKIRRIFGVLKVSDFHDIENFRRKFSE